VRSAATLTVSGELDEPDADELEEELDEEEMARLKAAGYNFADVDDDDDEDGEDEFDDDDFDDEEAEDGLDEEYDDEAGMSDNNLETLRRAVDGIDELIQPGENLPEWCQEKIANAKSMLVAVWDYMKSEEDRGSDAVNQPVDEAGLWDNIHAKRKRIKSGSGERMRKPGSRGAPSAQNFKDAAKTDEGIEDDISEAEYQGRNVPLGKPMQGDVKKSKVYVRKPNGKVVKVNFGDKTMKIKKSNPGRRKNFRARHNCDNPGPRWKARYWSCRAW
jgi:hypothetical protein